MSYDHCKRDKPELKQIHKHDRNKSTRKCKCEHTENHFEKKKDVGADQAKLFYEKKKRVVIYLKIDKNKKY